MPAFSDPVRDDRADGAHRDPGQHVTGIVHTEDQPRQRHWRHQHGGQRQTGDPAHQYRCRRGGRGVRGRKAQPARCPDVDADRRVVGPLPANHPLDHHGCCVREERARRPAATRGASLAVAAHPPQTPPASRRCVRRSAQGLGPWPPCLGGPEPTERPPAWRLRPAAQSWLPVGEWGYHPHAGDSTDSHFSLLVNTGSASRYTRRISSNRLANLRCRRSD